MTKLVIAVLLASCASILVSADPSQGQSADEEAIKQIERLWDEAWNRHDPKALATLLAEDGDFVNVTGTCTGEETPSKS